MNSCPGSDFREIQDLTGVDLRREHLFPAGPMLSALGFMSRGTVLAVMRLLCESSARPALQCSSHLSQSPAKYWCRP